MATYCSEPWPPHCAPGALREAESAPHPSLLWRVPKSAKGVETGVDWTGEGTTDRPCKGVAVVVATESGDCCQRLL
eukprot:12919036-Alexandrium_andersonii.AAC.1